MDGSIYLIYYLGYFSFSRGIFVFNMSNFRDLFCNMHEVYNMVTESYSKLIIMRMVFVAAGERLPLKEVEERLVEMYVREVKLEYESVFVPFLKMCKRSSRTKVRSFYFQQKFKTYKSFRVKL